MVKNSLKNMCMICLIDTATEGQEPGVLELDDEAEAYMLLGGGLSDCLPCKLEVYHSHPAWTFSSAFSICTEKHCDGFIKYMIEV